MMSTPRPKTDTRSLVGSLRLRSPQTDEGTFGVFDPQLMTQYGFLLTERLAPGRQRETWLIQDGFVEDWKIRGLASDDMGPLVPPVLPADFIAGRPPGLAPLPSNDPADYQMAVMDIVAHPLDDVRQLPPPSDMGNRLQTFDVRNQPGPHVLGSLWRSNQAPQRPQLFRDIWVLQGSYGFPMGDTQNAHRLILEVMPPLPPVQSAQQWLDHVEAKFINAGPCTRIDVAYQIRPVI